MELSEDRYCNLSMPIPNEQTLVYYHYLKYNELISIILLSQTKNDASDSDIIGQSVSGSHRVKVVDSCQGFSKVPL